MNTPPRFRLRRPVNTVPGRGGFTLLEMMLVLVITGVLVSIAAPAFAPGRWRVDSAVAEVTVTLHGAQRLAVLRQHDVVVRFPSDGRSLRIHQDRDNDGNVDDGEDLRTVSLPETIGFDRGEADPLQGTSTGVSFASSDGEARLTFHRNGSASEEGVAYLRPTRGSMSEDVEAIRAVTVIRATGSVACYSYQTRSWEVGC